MIETVYVEDKENIEITTIGTTVNDGHLREMIGRYGLGERNGRMLIEFCVQNNLSIWLILIISIINVCCIL